MKTLLIFLIKDNRECRLLRINSQDNSDELHQMQQIVHGLIECVGVYRDDMTSYPTEFDFEKRHTGEQSTTGYELICNEEFLFEPNAEENYAASFLCRQLIKGDTFLVLANYETGEFESIDPHSKSFRVIVNALCKDGIEALIEQCPYDDLSPESYS